MAITPQHQKGEPTEADLEKAYNRARSIGLFLVEKYAREAMRVHPKAHEFIMAYGGYEFRDSDNLRVPHTEQLDTFTWVPREWAKPLWNFLTDWDSPLSLTYMKVRFTADGPIRREW